ncbi:MAG: PAS domain S-box protein, partial [Ktedonobacteraceae bacterium]|nr:PAS domain S-box protein [Ktedonobacteraceae bacterium]
MQQKPQRKSGGTVTHRSLYDGASLAHDKLKDLEELSCRSERRYHALSKATAQITWTTAPDGRVIEDAPFWRAYTGQSEEEIKGWNWLQAIHPDDQKRVLATWQQTVATRTPYESEYRLRRVDGVYHYMLTRGVPVFEQDGTLSEWVGICTDITERKLLEEQMMARASQLEAIFEAIKDGLVVYDVKGNVIQTNVAGLALLSKGFDYYGGDVYERLAAYKMRDEQGRLLPVDQTPLMRVLRGEELTDGNAVDIRLQGSDGSDVQLSVSGAPMRNKEGQIVGAVCVFRNVTTRRRLEAEHLRLLADLQEANIQLELVNKVQTDFISIVSHEFRTALTGIQGFSELLRDGEFDIADVKEYGTDINIDVQRLNRMITELLDLERMKSGKMMFHPESLNINALLMEATERLRSAALYHPMHFLLDEALPEIRGDHDKLTQVVTNLLSNAIKYSPDGGDIWITSQRANGSVRVSIRDSGIGIPADALDKIFSRYDRVDSEKTRYIHGTGLGLPIVQQIVEMHGGKVGVESTLGHG